MRRLLCQSRMTGLINQNTSLGSLWGLNQRECQVGLLLVATAVELRWSYSHHMENVAYSRGENWRQEMEQSLPVLKTQVPSCTPALHLWLDDFVRHHPSPTIISINFQTSLNGIQCAFQSLTIRETSEMKGNTGTERLGQEKKIRKVQPIPKIIKNKIIHLSLIRK